MNRDEMIKQLEPYKKPTGYYNVRAIMADENPDKDSLDTTFSAFFGGIDGEQESELVTLARELNATVEQRQAQEKKDAAISIMAKWNNGQRLTNAEMDILVDAGLARHTYVDSHSNRPTGIVATERGAEHANWEHEEGLGKIGL